MIRPAMKQLQVIDRPALEELSAQARSAPRLRKNLNMHASEQEPCNRLLNAIEPGTYIPPHCHQDLTKDESMVMVRGRMGLVVFNEEGRVTEKVLMEPVVGRCAVTIPHGVFHSLVALESGTIFFEAKAGPYRPLLPAEKAAWAPAEGAPGAAAYLVALREQFPA
jgi:cupin fold WbuC family metalloprotein